MGLPGQPDQGGHGAPDKNERSYFKKYWVWEVRCLCVKPLTNKFDRFNPWNPHGEEENQLPQLVLRPL